MLARALLLTHPQLCQVRLRLSYASGNLHYHTTDLRRASVKCCTSDVDCSQCRLYSGGWSSRLEPGWSDLASVEAFEDWLGMIAMLGRIHVNVPRPDLASDPNA